MSFVKIKFNFEFKSTSNFSLIEFNFNKVGILRDFCKKVGIQLEAEDYRFVLDFSFTKNDILKQEHLSFSPDNVLDFFPIILDYELPSEVLTPTFNLAENFYNQGNFAAATEKFKQVIILSHEINGPIHKLSAKCHRRLATIAFIEKDFDNAILLIRKAIIIYEKLSEFDSPFVANCYSELSTYCNTNKDYLTAFKCLVKSWEITMVNCPRNVSISK